MKFPDRNAAVGKKGETRDVIAHENPQKSRRSDDLGSRVASHGGMECQSLSPSLMRIVRTVEACHLPVDLE